MSSPKWHSANPTRRQLLAISAGIALGAVAPGRSSAKEPLVRLRRGINLWPWFSLTREQPAPSRAYDWPPYQADRVVPDAGDLATLRTVGFDFVRIPVDPGPLAAFAGKWRARLLADVMDAVRLALDAGLSAIVNLQGNAATHYWNPTNILAGDDPALLSAYLELVHDLARLMSKLDPARVILEPVNEPPQTCASAQWRALQLSILKTARAAAPHLTLVATGACGSMTPGLQALDPLAIDDVNVLYTFHFYEPYVFSHQGATWMTSEPMYSYLNGVPWPASAGTREQTLAASAGRLAADAKISPSARTEIERAMQRALNQYFEGAPDATYLEPFLSSAAEWADHHGIARERLILGEFGALRTDARYHGAAPADRARYIRDVRATVEAFGFPWALWNFSDGMGLLEVGSEHRLDPSILAALGLKLPRLPG
jgi:hypothetical protein